MGDSYLYPFGIDAGSTERRQDGDEQPQGSGELLHSCSRVWSTFVWHGSHTRVQEVALSPTKSSKKANKSNRCEQLAGHPTRQRFDATSCDRAWRVTWLLLTHTKIKARIAGGMFWCKSPNSVDWSFSFFFFKCGLLMCCFVIFRY